MIHGINNDYLYAVSKIDILFSDSKGNKVQSTGTGFWISKENNVFLITNRHVVQISYKRPEYSSFTNIVSISFDMRSYNDETKDVDISNHTVESCSIDFPSNEKDDIACISNIKVKGDVVSFTHIPFSMLATTKQFFNDLFVCDHVAFVGFPIVYDHKHIMPILRSGVISSDPRLNYSADGNDNGHCLAYEAFSTEGASGSPAFATQKGFKVGKGLNAPEGFYRPTLLIGINAGSYNVSKEHQHMSYMYKSDQIISLILLAESKL